MKNIKIIPAEISDAEILHKILLAAFRENYEKYGHYPPGTESLEWHRDKIGNALYYKILKDEIIIGGIHLIRQNGLKMRIEYLFINPDFHGNGIGSHVINLLEKKHKEIKTWDLFTPYKDFRNHHFYEKLNFKKIAEITPIPDSKFKLFHYEKKIQNI